MEALINRSFHDVADPLAKAEALLAEVQENLAKLKPIPENLARSAASEIDISTAKLFFDSLHRLPESRSLRTSPASRVQLSAVLKRTKSTRSDFLRSVARKDLETKRLFLHLAMRLGVRI